MRESEVHIMLGKLVHELLELEDGSWNPVCVLHRVMTEGVVTQSNRAGDRILCRESSKEARFIAPQFHALKPSEQLTVIVKHSPPPPLFKRWQDQDKAQWLGVSKSGFSHRYKRVLRKCVQGLRSQQ